MSARAAGSAAIVRQRWHALQPSPRPPGRQKLSRRKPMKSTTRMIALCAVATAMLAGPALADTSKMRIAFSNNYAGNSWRQAMLSSYDIVTKKAVADKIVAAADVFTTADKEVPTQ